MSGGSYRYLYMKEVNDLYEYLPEMREMADRLREMDEDGAAIEVDALADRIEGYHRDIRDRHRRLSDLMKAVEWYDSCDWGPDPVHDECDEL